MLDESNFRQPYFREKAGIFFVAMTNLPVQATAKLKNAMVQWIATTVTKQARIMEGDVGREGTWVRVLPTPGSSRVLEAHFALTDIC